MCYFTVMLKLEIGFANGFANEITDLAGKYFFANRIENHRCNEALVFQIYSSLESERPVEEHINELLKIYETLTCNIKTSEIKKDIYIKVRRTENGGFIILTEIISLLSAYEMGIIYEYSRGHGETENP